MLHFAGGTHYEGVRFNVVSITRVGGKFPEKKCYVTLEWPLSWPRTASLSNLLPCLIVETVYRKQCLRLIVTTFSGWLPAT